jgi:hypothetical protein
MHAFRVDQDAPLENRFWAMSIICSSAGNPLYDTNLASSARYGLAFRMRSRHEFDFGFFFRTDRPDVFYSVIAA